MVTSTGGGPTVKVTESLWCFKQCFGADWLNRNIPKSILSQIRLCQCQERSVVVALLQKLKCDIDVLGAL